MGIMDWLRSPVLRPGPPKSNPPLVLSTWDVRIYRAAVKRGQPKLFPGEFALVYVEGMDPDFSQNDNAPNEFNDLRLLLQVLQGTPIIVGKWEGTTEPGKFWTEHRMNPGGAFHIALGYQKCWIMGEYHNMTALRQYGAIKGHRDAGNTLKRTGPLESFENSGVHHHGGYNLPRDDLGRSSAGCQVGRLMGEHEKCMAMLKTDPRYVLNRNHVFDSTVLAYAEL